MAAPSYIFQCRQTGPLNCKRSVLNYLFCHSPFTSAAILNIGLPRHNEEIGPHHERSRKNVNPKPEKVEVWVSWGANEARGGVRPLSTHLLSEATGQRTSTRARRVNPKPESWLERGSAVHGRARRGAPRGCPPRRCSWAFPLENIP